MTSHKTEERTRRELDREQHQKEIAALKSELYSVKLENEGLKEKYEECREMATNPAEELKTHQTEIQTLQRKVDMMTSQMQEKETTLLQKLAEAEAETAHAKAKFSEYEEDLLRVTKEQQDYLKNEVKRHRNRAEDNLMAYWEADQKLTREIKRTADLQRRLDELKEKLAEYQQTPCNGRDDAAKDGYQVTSERSAANHHARQQHERQQSCRSYKRNQRHFNQG
ncbi:hypothetical protein GJAV_G00061300 [Gymnothorax javanicus]|nr:hypothetical protein GJAV_G00061300 [Gymnothorax javanicus]